MCEKLVQKIEVKLKDHVILGMSVSNINLCSLM